MILNIHPDNPDKRKMEIALGILKDGGVIVFPTDTVYSLGCDLLNSSGIERIARMKGLKPEKANFSIICNDLSHISEYSKPMENHTFKMMKSLLPGPFTFILEANRNVPRIFSSNRKTIGIRVPDNNITRELVQMLGRPIVSTSLHSEDTLLEYPTDPEDIHEQWGNQVELVIDGGPGGLEGSTVLDCTAGEMVVVREGKGMQLLSL
ncbi:MAG: L-threonylcarbamoyladenylate synthase [Flavobacteriales bacterium]|nr:L-threonylcarbamoyladenylate synthase [Flavobacteriales bacterium]